MEDVNSIEKACGCCLSVNNLIQMTDEPINHLALCFSIQIQNCYSSGKFPALICNLCNVKIKECYKFRCQILDSQTKLKNLHTSWNSNNDFKIETNSHVFNITNSIKQELFSDLDDSIDADNLITQNQNKKKREVTELKFKKEDLETIIKQEVKSNLHLKKKVSIKRTKIVKKDHIITNRSVRSKRPAETLPFKLDSESLSCKICGEKFVGHRLLVSHMAIHYPNFVCETCGKPFVLKSYLHRHMKSHDGENTTCTICKKVLKVSSLPVHMKIHSDDKKRFACPHCPERFGSYHHRAKHMEKAHNVDIYKYHCNICSKKFHLPHLLSTHVRSYHFRELNVACDVCGKGFFGMSELNRHMVKHTGEKKYKCDICSTSYIKKWSLILHMRTHNGNVIKHKCMQCDKEFTQRGSLRVHIKNIHEK